jgi:hypothetical protein
MPGKASALTFLIVPVYVPLIKSSALRIEQTHYDSQRFLAKEKYFTI